MDPLKFFKQSTCQLFLPLLFILLLASHSFGLEKKADQYCWSGVNSGVFIRQVLTEIKATGTPTYYRVNGSVTLASGQTNLAFGTAVYDANMQKTRLSYTVVVPTSFSAVSLELDPVTLNGTKTVSNNAGGVFTEDVLYRACE